MGNIHPNDHGRRAIQPSSAVWIQFVIDATHFHVNLQRHIRKVLRIGLANLGRLNTNTGHVQEDVAKMLQAFVYGLITTGQHDEEQSRLWLDTQERISNGVDRRPPHGIGYILRWKLGCSVIWIGGDLHSAHVTHIAEAGHHLVKLWVCRTSEFISVEAILDHKHCPLFEACTDCKLDSSEIPGGFVIDGSRSSLVPDPRFGQDAPGDYSHVRTNVHAEGLELWPGHSQSEAVKTLVDDCFSIHVGGLTRYSDHCGSMIICQFSTERLIRKYFANFWR